jgi:low temperature requirement protein LtrA
VRTAQEADKPSRIVGLGNYTLILMVIGIIAIAVGDELAIADPGGPTSFDVSLLIFGGPAIFLFAQLAFMRGATGHLPRSRILACAALLVLALATGPFSLVVAITVASAVLVAVAVDDARAEPHSATPDMAAP